MDGRRFIVDHKTTVSMKSGLEGRNNTRTLPDNIDWPERLNEVRPRRPEQSATLQDQHSSRKEVSMKSGLEGRNNPARIRTSFLIFPCLNEVRPRRPEQWGITCLTGNWNSCLNEVRPRRPEQSERGRRGPHTPKCLNEVRPRRPEQSISHRVWEWEPIASQ